MFVKDLRLSKVKSMRSVTTLTLNREVLDFSVIIVVYFVSKRLLEPEPTSFNIHRIRALSCGIESTCHRPGSNKLLSGLHNKAIATPHADFHLGACRFTSLRCAW
jgi:hypothetical protein